MNEEASMLVKQCRTLISDFNGQPNYIKFIFILTVSIFLPIYITIPATIAACIFFLRYDSKFKVILNAPYIKLFALLGILLLAVPLFYKNYYGFACGILFDIFLIVQFYINKIMNQKLFDSICTVCCSMSLFCAAVAFIEKIFNIQTRVTALTYNSNFYAYLIELTVLICFYEFVKTKKPLYLLMIAANIAALILSDCRSAWTAIFAGLLVFSIILKKKGTIISLFSIAAGIAVAILLDHSLFPRYGIMGASTANRVYIWKNAFNDFLNHPIFGRGLLAFYQVSGNVITPHAHSIFIDLLECTGIVGTAIIIFAFILIIKKLVYSFKHGNEQMKFRVALFSGIVAATLIHGITDTPIMGIQTGLYFFIVLSFRPHKHKKSINQVKIPERQAA